MKRAIIFISLLMLTTVLLAVSASAWDVSYEGNVMPNATELGTSKWGVDWIGGLSASSTDGNTLHLVDNRADSVVYLWREADGFPAGTPLTMEARVKVIVADTGGFAGYAVGMGISTVNKAVHIGLWPDKVWVGEYEDGTEIPVYVPVDMTQFHTFRLASMGGSDPRFSVWMDGDMVYSGVSYGGAYRAVYFGGYLPKAEMTSDSYWDYVRYSTEYVPVPEPCALMTLVGGLGALAVPLMRRKRKR